MEMQRLSTLPGSSCTASCSLSSDTASPFWPLAQRVLVDLAVLLDDTGDFSSLWETLTCLPLPAGSGFVPFNSHLCRSWMQSLPDVIHE